ncbi:coil containing protein [Vibrio phage 1.210.O._10N.222.52.C2]|nr:coil containing protein [Vibrio phage 1.210.O._10N.222.52.C2]
MPEKTSQAQLLTLAAKVRKTSDKIKTMRGETKLSSKQKALREEVSAIQAAINKQLTAAEKAIEQLDDHINLMSKEGCFRNGSNSMNNKIILPRHPEGEHVAIAKAEFKKLFDIETKKSVIARDIGISRQAFHNMCSYGYATPQSAQRISLIDKYSSIDKRKLRPDVQDDMWDLLLVEED